jgi:AcrR family transcriptional regulator
MPSIAKGSRRGYRSELREQQAEATRSRILDATVRVMSRGLSNMSIPAVAREAGVSVPTVYRHFGTKRELFAALYPHIVYRAASIPLTPPSSFDGFAPGLRAHFARLDSLGEREWAALLGPGSEEARRANMPDRIALTRALVDAITPPDRKVDRARLTRLLTVLTGTSAFRTWRDYLNSSVDDAVADIEWATRAFISASTREDDE